MQPQLAPQTSKKKGLSGIAIFFIVCGVLTVLALGTCGVSALIIKNKWDGLKDDDAGPLVLVSPPEVKAELAGPKKDYVGAWKSAHGNTVVISADGAFAWSYDEGGTKSSMNAAIAAFKGNDIELRAFIRMTYPVTNPPHREGDRWSMTMKDVTFERPHTP